jgi:hypothetical protein
MAARLTVIFTVLDDLSLLTKGVELGLVDDGLFSLQSLEVLDAAGDFKSRSASKYEKHDGHFEERLFWKRCSMTRPTRSSSMIERVVPLISIPPISLSWSPA